MCSLQIKTGTTLSQLTPHSHSTAPLCNYHTASPELVAQAIESSVKAQRAWEDMPWNDRAAIFLKAADLCAGKYRSV